MGRGFVIIFCIIFLPSIVHAAHVSDPVLSAQGVAVYGWKKGIPTLLYQQKQFWLFPLASISKLVTAEVAISLYSARTQFEMSRSAVLTPGETRGITVGARYTRNDLLRALLVSSSNDAANQFAEGVGRDQFVAKMNAYIHEHQYSKNSFINATGLDPDPTLGSPNRLTPYQLSRLISNIYESSSLLSSILDEKSAHITDIKTHAVTEISSSDELNHDPAYSDRILISKTGRTSRAGETLVFITQGFNDFDYVSVALLASKNRSADGREVLDWLEKMKQK